MEQWNDKFEMQFYVYKKSKLKCKEGYSLFEWLKLRYVFYAKNMLSSEEMRQVYECKEELILTSHRKNSIDTMIEALESEMERKREKAEKKEKSKWKMFMDYARLESAKLDSMYKWILKEENYKKKKEENSYKIRPQEYEFLEYLLEIYDKEMEREILKKGKSCTIKKSGKCYTNNLEIVKVSKGVKKQEYLIEKRNYEYYKFINGIWEGIQLLKNSRWMEIKIGEVKTYWKEKYGWSVEERENILEKIELEIKKEELERVLLLVLEQKGLELETIRELNIELEELLCHWSKKGIDTIHLEMENMIL